MFVGYAPHDKPEVTIAVVVENAGGGGSNAAPVARQMLDYYFSPLYNAPQLPSVAEIAIQQQQRYDAMVKREQGYAEAAAREKAAKEMRKAQEQQQATSQPLVESPISASVTAASSVSETTPTPAVTEEKPIDDQP